jgi:hypothetical protein
LANIDLNAEAEGQIETHADSFSLVSSIEAGESVDQDDIQHLAPDLWHLVELALPAAPVNFMPLQIQLQDVGGDVVIEEV